MSQPELFSIEEMTNLAPPDWSPPTELPEGLSGVVAVDLETRDEGIRDGRGKGWTWDGGGQVVGYSVAADDFCAYLPIAHEGGGNLDPDVVRRWLNRVLSDESQPKIFANAMYDLGWARRDGVEIRGPTYDVQWAEALLDEHRRAYSLDSIAKTHLGTGKDETTLNEAARAYGIDPKSGLWQLPASYVGRYAEGDANLTRRIWSVQEPKLHGTDLWSVFELEHSLIPLYLDMSARGVRVDADRADVLREKLRDGVEEIVEEICHRTGARVDVWAAQSIAKAFDAEGLHYGLTPKTRQPSITQALLESTDHWLAKMILDARKKDKLAGTFLDGVILGNLHDGRVHGEIHPLKSDEGGTVTGRLSYSSPNLQFIPVRTEQGKEIRKLFLPEDGERWASLDFNQQEPRLLVHYAALVTRGGKPLPGAIEARDRYRTDPDMNYHEFAAELTKLPYSQAKIMNLAIIYGRGIDSTATELELSHEETRRMFNKHHDEMPFARALSEVCQRQVRRHGELRSLLGRRVRFPFWEPASWDVRDGRMYPLEKAKREWPGQQLVRARMHKALNSLIQPSAADQTKAAMRAVLDAGLGGHVLFQVHDELCCSVPDEATAQRIAESMRDAVELEVPNKIDVDMSDRWGGEK